MNKGREVRGIMSLATKMGYIFICSKNRRGWGLKYFEIVNTY
jgi:hypothetical protein